MKTGLVFNAIVVVYSTEFQKDTKVKKIRKAGLEILGSDDLCSTYQRVWQTLPDFCKLLRPARN